MVSESMNEIHSKTSFYQAAIVDTTATESQLKTGNILKLFDDYIFLL